MLIGLEHLFCGQFERVGILQTGEGSRETLLLLSVLKGTPRQLERDFRQGYGVLGKGEMVLKWIR